MTTWLRRREAVARQTSYLAREGALLDELAAGEELVAEPDESQDVLDSPDDVWSSEDTEDDDDIPAEDVQALRELLQSSSHAIAVSCRCC